MLTVSGRSRLVIAALAAVLTACSDAAINAPRSHSGGPGLARQFIAARGQASFRTLADEYRDLARRVPDFTGVFFDAQGRLTIAHASPSLSREARREVVTRAARWSAGVHPGDAARLVRREFSYLALDSVYFRVLGPALTPLEFVTSSGIDETRGTIIVTVDTERGLGEVRALAARLGVPVRMVDVSRMARADAPVAEAHCGEECNGGDGGTGDRGMSFMTLRDSVRPAHGGLEISWDNLTVCTLGLVGYRVTSGAVDPSLGTYYMTAGHCGSEQGAIRGFAWGQPRPAVDSIGTEVWTAPILTGVDCPNGYPRCLLADVMVIRADDSEAPGYGVVKRTELNSIVINGLTGVSGQLYGALVGEVVYKVGRTTGTTMGRITHSCLNTSTRQALDLYVLCVQKASYVSGAGDSGSPVFMPFDPARAAVTPRTVGIHFASVLGAWPPEAFLSPITQIWRAQDYLYWW
jgi:hypothetical protein